MTVDLIPEDLTPEAVEALAREHDGIADAPYTPPTTALWHRETAATLRALSAEVARLRAELEDALDRAHYAEGTAALAMKHRDMAEADLASANSQGREQGLALLDKTIAKMATIEALLDILARGAPLDPTEPAPPPTPEEWARDVVRACRSALDDIAHGYDMDGRGAEATLQWAMQHASQALAALAPDAGADGEGLADTLAGCTFERCTLDGRPLDTTQADGEGR